MTSPHLSQHTDQYDAMKEPFHVVVVTRDNKRRRRLKKEKLDIRARCVTCICLLVLCAVGIGVVGCVLMAETKTGWFGADMEVTTAIYTDKCLPENTATTSTVSVPTVPALTSARASLPTPIRKNTECVVINDMRPECTDLLPYANTTAVYGKLSHELNPIYFRQDDDDDCPDEWVYFLCVHVLPECLTTPDVDWKPRCVCTSLNNTIYSHRKCIRNNVDNGFVDGDLLKCRDKGSPDAPDCLKP